jgi:hypothetical protein
MQKEEFCSGLNYDTLFKWFQDGHHREMINDNKNTMMTMFGGG